MDLQSIIADRVLQFAGRPLSASITFKGFRFVGWNKSLRIDKCPRGFTITNIEHRVLYKNASNLEQLQAPVLDSGFVFEKECQHYRHYTKSDSPTTWALTTSTDAAICRMVDAMLLLVDPEHFENNQTITLELGGVQYTTTFDVSCAVVPAEGDDGDDVLTEEDYLSRGQEVPERLRRLQDFNERTSRKQLNKMRVLVDLFKSVHSVF